MKKILFTVSFLLSLMVCVTSPTWAGALDDAIAGFAAAQGGNYDTAIRLFTKAIESGELSQEDLSKTYYNRGDAWRKKGDYDKAIADLNIAIESGALSREDLSKTYCNRGLAWYHKGNFDKAIADYSKAIKLDQKYARAYYNRALAWGNKGGLNKAIADYTKAIEIYPDYAKAYYNRGLAWMKKGDDNKAIADFTKVIELNPKYAFAYYNRGKTWREKGDYGKAVADYTTAIEINPNLSEIYNDLAWLMATCPEGQYRDGTRAVELAEKAVALIDAASILDTLAAAYAEAGRFQDAITTQEKAITKLKQEGGTQYLPECEERLSSYKAGKPWREK
jgi:tetratricopeptide (TPR) repeat protein